MDGQRDFKMPETGEAWRHYKGRLYTIIGIALDDKGELQVIYTLFGHGLVQLPMIFTQSLGRFVQSVEALPGQHQWRFCYEREQGCDPGCAFINPNLPGGSPR